jgi:hypothetical protein
MGLNRHPVLGLRDSPLIFSLLVLHHHWLILLCFYIIMVPLSCSFFYMLMISLSPENNSTAIQSLLAQLGKEFNIKVLRPLKFFLKLQIEYRSSGFFFHQHKYASDLLQKFNTSTCKSFSTLFVSLSRLSKDDGVPLFDPTPFCSMVGG